MFETHVGAAADETSIAYLRPETAQSIFVQFKNILEVSRKKLPFGIAQIGKAFRNEINPRNFTLRLSRVRADGVEDFCRAEQGMGLLEYWKEERLKFYENIGIQCSKLHVLTVPDEERAFYWKFRIRLNDSVRGQEARLGTQPLARSRQHRHGKRRQGTRPLPPRPRPQRRLHRLHRKSRARPLPQGPRRQRRHGNPALRSSSLLVLSSSSKKADGPGSRTSVAR